MANFKDASRRQFDLIAAWSVDRLGRSLQDLVGFLTEIHALGVNLFLHQQGIDTTTPAGKALFQMMGVFAEFERAMIQDRVRAGLERAKAQGKVLGRPSTDAGKVLGRPSTALSHLAFLLLITYLTAGLGFNKFNGLGSQWDAAIEPLLARCDNAGDRGQRDRRDRSHCHGTALSE